MPIAFVTVGSTEFDLLIESVTSDRVVAILRSIGIDKLLVQIGRGRFQPEKTVKFGVEIDFYRSKPSIEDDLKSADLVIGHAGAGTCLEALELDRKLIAVVNESLQDNHQLELALQLAADNYSLYCTPENLASCLVDKKLNNLSKFPVGRPELFAVWLDNLLAI